MKQKSQQEWRSLIKLQFDGNLPIKGFCKEHKISTSCFYKHKKILSAEFQNDLSRFVKVKAPLITNPSIESIKVQYQQTTINLPLNVESVWLASFVKALA